jgi:3-hydroxyisobutyrate dehydrogenase
LPTSEHVREVIFSLDGLASTAKSGLMIIDQTTGDPLATRAMAEELRARGVCLVDAPVSGGTQGAEGGTIAIMVGGTDDEYLRATSVLSAISPNHFHAGAVGAGHVMKLVNNLLSGAQRLVALEGMALAVKNGVDPRVAHQILLAGGGRSAYLERTFPAEVLTGQLNPGFTLSLMHKDIRLACQLGLESAVPMFFGSLTREFYQMCLNEHGPTAQVETAALAVDRLAGTHIVPSKLEMQEPTFE